VTPVALKQEKQFEVYASGHDSAMRFVRAYPIAAASGSAGPKLRNGDRQVPEGIYAIESLNPNSRFHLALRVGYPNTFDREMAARDARGDLGSDIMIHGGSGSIGCLAMGDEAAEDLFVLAADVGIEKVTLILAPGDLRRRSESAPRDSTAEPAWLGQLYERITTELLNLPTPP
jgi:murein L,D-transpeptidase YafK